MKKLSLVAIALLFTAVSAHGYCTGVLDPAPPGTVCGTVYKWTANGWVSGTTNYNVKFCSAATGYCRSTVTQTFYDPVGTPFQAFTFLNFGGNTNEYVYWYVYAWNDAEYYGNSTNPISLELISGLGLHGISIHTPPRPLPPNPYYPANGGSYTAYPNYPVIWKSGMDAARNGYPVTYEVWYKYWPFGGVEPVSWSLSRGNMPCHDNGSGPDAANRCSTSVADPGAIGNWRWKVVANLDVSASVHPALRPTIFKTTSSQAYFTWNP